MQIQVPQTTDPVTRTIFSFPGGEIAVDTVKGGSAVAECDLPEGVNEIDVTVSVVGVGNNGLATGEPQVLQTADPRDLSDPPAVVGVDVTKEGLTAVVAEIGEVFEIKIDDEIKIVQDNEVEQIATSDVQMPEPVAVDVYVPYEPPIDEPEMTLDEIHRRTEAADVISPWSHLEPEKKGGPDRGPQAMGL